MIARVRINFSHPKVPAATARRWKLLTEALRLASLGKLGRGTCQTLVLQEHHRGKCEACLKGSLKMPFHLSDALSDQVAKCNLLALGMKTLFPGAYLCETWQVCSKMRNQSKPYQGGNWCFSQNETIYINSALGSWWRLPVMMLSYTFWLVKAYVLGKKQLRWFFSRGAVFPGRHHTGCEKCPAEVLTDLITTASARARFALCAKMRGWCASTGRQAASIQGGFVFPQKALGSWQAKLWQLPSEQ